MGHLNGKFSLKISRTTPRSKKNNNNDGASSQQSIGLDDEDEKVGGVVDLGTEPKRSRHLRGEEAGER